MGQTGGGETKLVSEYGNRDDVAELLDISVPTVDQMTRDGQLPYFKVGRQYRYPLALVRQQLEAQALAQLKRADQPIERAALMAPRRRPRTTRPARIRPVDGGDVAS